MTSLVVLVLSACAAEDVTSDELESRASAECVAVLAGEHEVPSRETNGRGNARFKVVDDEQSLGYRLVVANIRNVVASHIHIGPEDGNGPAVLFLYGNVPAGGGLSNGVLAEGHVDADDLVGPLAGKPLSNLLNELESGNAYVNVHTNDGVAPVNEGPGDFPGGEIRGQIGCPNQT